MNKEMLIMIALLLGVSFKSFAGTGNADSGLEFLLVWARTKSGSIFQNEYGRDIYSAKVDTINGITEFNESHD